MNAVVHRTSRTRHWDAWGGSLGEIERMVKTAQRLFGKRVEAYLDNVSTLAGSHADPRQDDTYDQTREDIVARLRKDINFATTVTHGPDSSTGPLEDVLKELDRRSVTALKFTGRIGFHAGEHITLSMTWGRNENWRDKSGIDLKVETTELGWAQEAVATMSSEIDKGCPKWMWIHKFIVRCTAGSIWAVGLLLIGLWTAASLFGVGLWDKVENAPVELQTSIRWTSVLILLFAFISAMTIFAWKKCFYWFFPPIEIHGDGQDSTTVRRITLLASPFVTVALGIVVNIIS